MNEHKSALPESGDDDLELMGVPDAVKTTNMPKTRIYELVKRNEIPHIRIGGRIYFRRTRLKKWLATLEEEAEKEE